MGEVLGGTERHRSPRPWLLWIVIAVAAISVIPTGSMLFPSGHTTSEAPLRAAHGASSLLAQAEASLARGAGPALGSPLACSSSAGSARCTMPGHPAPPTISSKQYWTNVSGPVVTPPAGAYFVTMSYDAADGYVVLFGGCNYYGSCPLGSTWAFSGGQWTDLTNMVSQSPPAREYAAMAYDAADGYIVLYGGYGRLGLLNDTWTYHDYNWTQVATNGTFPAARWGPAMAYDSKDGYIVMFGGYTYYYSPYYLDETWTFLHGNWTNRTGHTGSTPGGRYYAAISDDPADGYVLMFGGYKSSGLAGDTWKFSNHTWTSVSPSTAPAARYSMTMDYDPLIGAVVLYGGYDYSYPYYQNDTWTYTGGNWTNASAKTGLTPPGRYGAGFAWDTRDGYGVLFGGYEFTGINYGLFSDTWAFGPAIIASFSISPSEIDLGQHATLNVSALSDATPLNYSYTGTPPGCSPGNASLATCTPNATGSSLVEVRVNDTAGDNTTVSANLTVASDPALRSFQIAPTVVTSGSAINLTTNVTGGTGIFTFSFSSLPSGCGAQNRSSYSCRPGQAGTFNVTVHATDTAGMTVSGNATLKVNPRPNVALFSANPSATDVGRTVSFDANVTGGTGTLTYLYAGLPTGCAAPNGPRFSCVMNQSGVFPISVTATDQFGWNSTRSVTVTVNPDPQILSARITPTSVDEGTTVTITINATGGTGALRFSDSGAPTRCGSLLGASTTCQPASAGNFSVVLEVNDTVGATATVTVPLQVFALPAVTLFAATPAGLDQNQSVTLSVTTTGGAPPLLFNYTGLPAGCASADAPTLTCTPSREGSTTVHVLVKDAHGASVASSRALEVHSRPSIGSVFASPNASSEGYPVSITVTATGGTLPYSFAYSGLPTGCTSANASSITCTPKATGTFSIQVQVTDAAGVSVAGHASLVVSTNGTGQGSGTTSGLSGSSTTYGIVAAVIVAALLAVLLLRRRSRSSGGTGGTEEPVQDPTEGPSGAEGFSGTEVYASGGSDGLGGDLGDPPE
jgi:hypothetical protein